MEGRAGSACEKCRCLGPQSLWLAQLERGPAPVFEKLPGAPTVS